MQKKLQMRDKATYEYAVIRVLPKVEREEFVNVGVILFSKPKRFLDMKVFVHEAKLLGLSPKLDLQQINDYLLAWEQVCKGAPAGGRIGEMELASRFRWLTASRSTIIQTSPTHTGLCTDPAEVLAKAFEFYVK